MPGPTTPLALTSIKSRHIFPSPSSPLPLFPVSPLPVSRVECLSACVVPPVPGLVVSGRSGSARGFGAVASLVPLSPVTPSPGLQ
jgi:hypothetical protein